MLYKKVVIKLPSAIALVKNERLHRTHFYKTHKVLTSDVLCKHTNGKQASLTLIRC